MSHRAVGLVLVLGLGGLVAPPVCWASRCNQVTVVSDTTATGAGADTLTTLSSSAGKICSVEFIANAANGWVEVVDSPDGTDTHSQAVVKSEPGSATALNSDSRWYGDEGRPTRFGIAARVVNGVAIIQWSGTSP